MIKLKLNSNSKNTLFILKPLNKVKDIIIWFFQPWNSWKNFLNEFWHLNNWAKEFFFYQYILTHGKEIPSLICIYNCTYIILAHAIRGPRNPLGLVDIEEWRNGPLIIDVMAFKTSLQFVFRCNWASLLQFIYNSKYHKKKFA